MVNAIHIDPDSIYDDHVLTLDLGLSLAAVRRARRAGRLRYTRLGLRTLYLGSWVLDWLRSEPDSAAPLTREERIP
jgi:hypothetical protein